MDILNERRVGYGRRRSGKLEYMLQVTKQHQPGKKSCDRESGTSKPSSQV